MRDYCLAFLLCVLSISVVLSTPTTIYVSPDAVNSKVQCGTSIQSPCGSIVDAIASFDSYSFPGSGNPKLYPPLVIALLPGTYFSSATSKNVSDTVVFYQHDITIQPATPNTDVVISGKYFTNDLFNIGLSKPAEWGAKLTVTGITFDSWSSQILAASSIYDLSASFSNCTIQNSAGGGGNNPSIFLIYSYGSSKITFLNFNKCTMDSNSAKASSSLIYTSGVTVSITNSNFNNNNFTTMITSSSIVTMSNSNVTNSGRVAYAINGNMTITGCNFKNNQDSSYIFYSVKSGVSISTSNFISNSIGSSQNGILTISGAEGYYFTVSGSTFSNNNGTPIYSTGNNLAVKGSTFQNNQGYYGGGVYQSDTIADIASSIFIVTSSGNSLSEMIYLSKVPSLSIESTNFKITSDATGVSSKFSMIECQGSAIYLSDVTMDLAQYRSIDCTSCSVTIRSGNQYQCEVAPTTSSTSSSDESTSSTSSSTTSSSSGTTGNSGNGSTTSGASSGNGGTITTTSSTSTSTSSTTTHTTGDANSHKIEMWVYIVAALFALLLI
ncbi:hypothetical protein CYY_002587 [Polysphondylium violaceum]|uniref:Uncharacterized protein n=1 Tax=Polysphondylium violaceum TaxID=133409 RepID=A0A8J4V0R4_9MYCE|nr:hypothetical protein CYY_002587 [Polysphondylium violaceum]